MGNVQSRVRYGLRPHTLFDEPNGPNENEHDEYKTAQGANDDTGDHPFRQSCTVEDLSNCRVLNDCSDYSVWGTLSKRWNDAILNDKGVNNQWGGSIRVVDIVFDKQAM